jgi:DNA primase
LMFGDSLKGSPHAIVTEGPIDALHCARLKGAVAAMGKVISKGQVALILRSGVKKVYLALDPDAAAETKKLLSTLSDLECFLLEPPSGKKDMGECSEQEVYHAFLNAPLLNPGHLFIFFNRK